MIKTFKEAYLAQTGAGVVVNYRLIEGSYEVVRSDKARKGWEQVKPEIADALLALEGIPADGWDYEPK